MRTNGFILTLIGCLFVLPACEAGGELGGTPPDEPPPSSKVESALVSGDGDELFPRAEGQHVVCLRLNPKSQDLENGVNCIQCPQCENCAWDIMHVDSDTKEQQVLETTENIQSSPRLSDGRAYWAIREDNKRKIIIWDLNQNSRAVFTMSQSANYGVAPELQGDFLYWKGYSQQHQKQGLFQSNIQTGNTTFLFGANFRDINYIQGNQLSQLNHRFPAIITPEAIYWATSDGPGRSVKMWRFDTGKESTIAHKSSGEFFALSAGDGFIAWKESDHSCWNNGECQVSLKVFVFGEGEVDLTPADGQISRYGHLSTSADKVFWADFRFGPYALFGRDIYNPQSVELRYTSEDAIVGSSANPVVSGTHLIWMDRRHDNWDIYSRPL